MNPADVSQLDSIDHVALQVVDVPQALAWYQSPREARTVSTPEGRPLIPVTLGGWRVWATPWRTR